MYMKRETYIKKEDAVLSDNNNLDFTNYFEKFLVYESDEMYGKIAFVLNEDINNYMDYSIKQYNNDKTKGTDLFCFKKFLDYYFTAINVFGLHSELNCKKTFNRFINYCLVELSKC